MKRLREFLEAEKPASRALGRLVNLFVERGGSVAVFGGAARDIVLHGKDAEPRDLDLVTSGVDLEQALATFETARSGFGAYRFKCDGASVDAWPLEETWAFKRLGIANPTFGDLMKTTFFNVECIAIELPAGIVHEGGFEAAFRDQTLELNYAENPAPAVCLVRTSAFVKRFGFKLGARLEDWLLARRPGFKPDELMQAQRTYFGKEFLTAEELLEPLNAACVAAERRRSEASRDATRTPKLRASSSEATARRAPSAASEASSASERLPWTPLEAIADPTTLASPFVKSAVVFWNRVSGVCRELFDDFDARVQPGPKPLPELDELARLPPSIDAVRRVHAIVTREQAAVPARLVDGTWRHVALAHGEFKTRPNEARQRGGRIVEFCPPELVVPELQRILREHERIPEDCIDVRATWLLAGILSVHPFIDGNGRVARVLSDIELRRAGLPTHRVSVDTRGAGYLDGVEASFHDLRPLRDFVVSEVESAVGLALRLVEQPHKVDQHDANAAERLRLQLARERFAAELSLLQRRQPCWLNAIEEAIADAPPRSIVSSASHVGPAGPDCMDRLLQHGLRVRAHASAVTLTAELDIPGFTLAIDLAPAGALGVAAYWAAASAGFALHREKFPPLLLLGTEAEDRQVERLRSWVHVTLVKTASRAILHSS